MTIFNFGIPQSGSYTFPEQFKSEEKPRLKENFTFEEAIKFIEQNLKRGVRKT